MKYGNLETHVASELPQSPLEMQVSHNLLTDKDDRAQLGPEDK